MLPLSLRPRRLDAARAAVGVAAASVALGLVAPAHAHVEGSVVTFAAEADARVDEATPTTNYGTSFLRVNGGSQPDVESYLRFTVAGLSGSVVRARLRLRVTNGTVDGPSVHAASAAWLEGTITWATRPPREPAVLADAGVLTAGTWAELDVTSHVTGDGTYGFALVTPSSDGSNFDSRETASRPELVVEVAGTGPPVSTAPPAISGTARAGRTLTAESGAWTGAQPMAFAYQWRRCDGAGEACADVAEATSATYAVTSADVGATLRVAVTATNAEGSSSATSPQTPVVLAAPPPGDPLVAAAGDIAGCDFPEDELTARVLDALEPVTVLPLGDTVYERGTAAEFRDCYAPTWGRHKHISSPVVGNHEYQTAGAAPYFDYFGAAAGDRTKGYYSYDLGTWRVYALNSNCSIVSCSAGSAQEQWLRADLAANPRSCKLALTHHPRFSSAATSSLRSTSSIGPLYKAFYDASGDVWLGAHAHFYERLARLGPTGAIDRSAGIRNFVVGTGGAAMVGFGSPLTGSEARNNTAHGVLKLGLHATSYDWEFAPIAGATFTDTGSDTCAGAVTDTTPPSAPANLSAIAPSGSQVDLSWTASTDNVGVTGYDVLRDGTRIATTTTSGYTDTSVTAGTTYTYTAKARDAAGNISAVSNAATVTPGATSISRTFAPDADARVDEAAPDTNYRTSYLRANGGSQPDVESYLRFTVSGVAGPVRSARLRLWVTNGTIDGPAVWSAAGDWTESALTWRNRPARTGAALGDKGAVAAGTWTEYDVTPLVTGDGARTFVLATTSTDGIDMSSREASNASQRPQLVVNWE
jgi:chitodextrinase